LTISALTSVSRGSSGHHFIHCEGQHVRPRTTNDGFKLAGKQPNVLVEALQRTRLRDPQEIAVGENAGHRGREQNQSDHGQRQTRGQLHGMASRRSNTAGQDVAARQNGGSGRRCWRSISVPRGWQCLLVA
jgi:hypothetical protein